MPLLCQARSAGLPDSCSTKPLHSRQPQEGCKPD
jgi:hypothetical protein